MAFVEDRQLLELSVSPKKSLFPVLNRAEAMSPLIVLLALIPPLYVLANRTLTPLDALWGLKAVALTTADAGLTWLDPATPLEGQNEIRLKWQPPLSSWLIAGLMQVSGTDRALALVLPSFLGTAGLIVCVFGLSDRLRGPQFAWWATCLTAIHGPILQGAQTPAPVSLTLAFVLATCWGFVAHCQDSKRLVSLPLAGSGLAWGLCWLAGGPVALVVLAILLIYVLAQRQEVPPSARPKPKTARRSWKGQPALISLGILCLIGLAVGGWWSVWMLARHGLPFLAGWLMGSSYFSGVPVASVDSAGPMMYDLSQMGGALSGLTLLGLAVGLWLLKQPEAKTERPGLSLILAWATCAGLVWLGLKMRPHHPDAFAIVWRGFFLLPTVLLAALAIEQIGARRLGYVSVLLSLGFTIWLLLIVPVEVGFGWNPDRRPLWPSLLMFLRQLAGDRSFWVLILLWKFLFLTVLGAVLAWVLWTFLKVSDLRLRMFFRISLGGLVAVHGLIGFLGLRQSTADDRALTTLRNELIKEPDVARWTIVSPRPSPLTLRFFLTSLWPEAESLEIDTWWDKRLTRDIWEDRTPTGSHIVVDWNPRDTRIPTLREMDPAERPHIIDFTPVGSPQILWNHRLRIYRREVGPPK